MKNTSFVRRLLLGHNDSAKDKQVSKQEWVKSHDQPGFIDDAAIPWAVGVLDIGDARKR